MVAWARLLEQLGQVRRFDYPYMREGRRSPDKLPKLVEAHREALQAVAMNHMGPIVLIGKSMGGRVGCHLALEERVASIVCLGYPLKGMGKAGRLRDEVLLALGTPILFVQGTRDALCPLDSLATVRQRMRAKSELYVVESGNHSLQATQAYLKSSGQTQANIDAGILATIDAFTRAGQ